MTIKELKTILNCFENEDTPVEVLIDDKYAKITGSCVDETTLFLCAYEEDTFDE